MKDEYCIKIVFRIEFASTVVCIEYIVKSCRMYIYTHTDNKTGKCAGTEALPVAFPRTTEIDHDKFMI